MVTAAMIGTIAMVIRWPFTVVSDLSAVRRSLGGYDATMSGRTLEKVRPRDAVSHLEERLRATTLTTAREMTPAASGHHVDHGSGRSFTPTMATRGR